MNSAAFTLAIIAMTGLLCQWLAWYVKLPAILFLLLAGIILGPALGWLQPDALLGDLLFPLVSLSVAIILFEGSLTLKLKDIKGLGVVVRRLVSTGTIITWLIASVSCRYFLQFDWQLSALFGALVVVSGPTVIVPMLRSVRPNSRIANILRWEGIVIDPIGALLAVLVYETIISLADGGGLSHTLWVFVKITLVGSSTGFAAAYLLGFILRRSLLPNYLQNLATVAMVLTAFAISNELQHESGLLTVTLMGIWLANMRDVNVEDILSFKENLTILLLSGLFVLLAARIEFDQILFLGSGTLGILAVIIFIARPLSVAICTTGSELSWRDRALIGWIFPRGIVAAAVSALFAFRLEAAGYAEAQLLVPLVFIVIIGTVVLQSGTARLLAKLLGVAEPSPSGFLIVGANPVARAMGKALDKHGFAVQLIDTNWESIRQARMVNLPTFFGNPISEYADQHLDLVGIGHLLALSPQREINALACMRYRHEFGPENLFSMRIYSERRSSDKFRIAERHKGRSLFSEELTYGRFTLLLDKGAQVKTTTLSDEYGFDALLSGRSDKIYLLFAISPKGRLHMFAEESKLTPETGWSVVSLENTDFQEEAPERIPGD